MIKRQVRILIVEDDESMSRSLQISLRKLGYEISGMVASAEEAITQVRTNLPDLILMDITLSGDTDGIVAAEMIHSLVRLPIVYITGRIDIEQWERARITEPFGYILKPFDLRELDVVIAAALYKSRKEEEIFSSNNSRDHYLQEFKGAIIHSDLNLRPQFVHGPIEEIIGYKADEIIAGRPSLEEILHPEERPIYSAEERDKLLNLPHFSLSRECRIITQDKQVRWIRETVKNMVNEQGVPSLIEWVIHDITDNKILREDLKQARNQLLLSEKLASIGQLTAGIAHEINNPVGYISNNLEILRTYTTEYQVIFAKNEQLKQSIEHNDLERAKAIVNELSMYEQEINLDYMTSDMDKLLQHTAKGMDKIQKIVLGLRTFARRDIDVVEQVDIEMVLEGILSIVLNEIKFKAQLTKEYAKLPPVRCNAQELGQVFINLLTNAAQAITDRGQIKIKTYTTSTHACIAISDTGCGIPLENLDKLFTPFFTTKKAGVGTGLGLSISYDIIKKHGGDILVNSQAGQGATFTVLLPKEP